MHSVTIAVDLAKSIREAFVADQNHRTAERDGRSRTQLQQFQPCRVLREAQQSPTSHPSGRSRMLGHRRTPTGGTP